MDQYYGGWLGRGDDLDVSELLAGDLGTRYRVGGWEGKTFRRCSFARYL